MRHRATGAVHIMQSWLPVTGSINSPRHSRELSQEQKEMMSQIRVKARLPHGSKVHPANRAKGRTGDKLQHMPGVHPGNTLPTSMSKTCAGDRAGYRDIPNADQGQTAFPGLTWNLAPRRRGMELWWSLRWGSSGPLAHIGVPGTGACLIFLLMWSFKRPLAFVL